MFCFFYVNHLLSFNKDCCDSSVSSHSLDSLLFYDSGSCVNPITASDAVKQVIVKRAIGKGSSISATNGAMTVANLAKKLHSPNAVAETFGLNMAAVAM